MKYENYIWSDKKRPLFGLPISFTTYTLLEDKLLVDKGLLSLSQEEVRLYRIMDVSLSQSIFQRIFNVGTIHCCTADKTSPELYIIDVKNPYQVKELLSNTVEKERAKKVSTNEFIDTNGFGHNN